MLTPEIAEILPYILIGFIAQLIDGALGMAYGVTASSMLLGAGVPPVVTSATVHAAECFTTGISAASHRAFGNIDREQFKRLLLPGILGAALGAYLLTRLPGDALKPWIAAYLLLMGVVIIAKAFREIPSRRVTSHLAPLGIVGALVDALGGGGWRGEQEDRRRSGSRRRLPFRLRRRAHLAQQLMGRAQVLGRNG